MEPFLILYIPEIVFSGHDADSVPILFQIWQQIWMNYVNVSSWSEIEYVVTERY